MSSKILTSLTFALSLLLSLMIFNDLQAQSYTVDVQKLSVEDGLSNRFVRYIHQDSQGFMWIGTEFGLNRYDGYNFKPYTTDNSGLRSNIVRLILEDQEQRLWLKQVLDSDTEIDIGILDLETDSIQSFAQVFGTTAPFKASEVQYFHTNRAKEIWLETQAGDVYCYRNGKFEKMFARSKPWHFAASHEGESFFWMLRDLGHPSAKLLKVPKGGSITDSIIWEPDHQFFGTEKGEVVWLFNRHKKELVKLKPEGGRQILNLAAINLPESFYRINRSSFHKISPFDGLIWWYHKDRQGHFYLIHPEKGIVYDLQAAMSSQFTYKDPMVTWMYFESLERTWVGTEDGIFIFNLKESRFSTMLTGELASNSMRGIVSDLEGNCYVNSYEKRYRVTPTGEESILPTQHVWMASARDSTGDLWFGNSIGFIEKLETETGNRENFPLPDMNLPIQDRQIMTILPYKKGELLLGSGAGLYTLTQGEESCRTFTNYNEYGLLAESKILHLQPGKEGVWIAASSGLYLLEKDKGITRRYGRDLAPPYNIPYEYLLHFHRDGEGIFWLASRGGGLLRHNPETGQSEQFTQIDGLSSDVIYAVYEDNKERLWLPSENGLMVFDKSSHKVNTYLKGNGIAHDEFNTISHYQTENGRLYFGGLAGVTVVDPDKFTVEKPAPSPLRITSCKVLDGKTGALQDRTASVRASQKLNINPSDRSLMLDFALLNYENSRQNSYDYKIEGLDQNWNSILGNSLHINALPYGSYVLRIHGKDIKGAVSSNELAIAIEVHKPLYLQSGFLIAAILTLILLVYVLFRWRLQRLKLAKIRLEKTVLARTQEIQKQKDKIEEDKNIIVRQAEKLKELDRAKSRFFANISHEFRTPLTLILGPLNQLISRFKQGEKDAPAEITEPLYVMQRNGKLLLQLIEEILDLSKLEARKLEVLESNTEVFPFIKRLYATFESHAQSRGMDYQLLYDADTNLHLLLDAEKVEKIITNFLSNAFKYTPDGSSVIVRVVEEAKVIRLEVEDEGSGIHPNDLPYIFDRFYQSKQESAPVQGGTGIGLALCKELATLLNGEVAVESQLGRGSTFTFKWPKQQITGAPEILPEDRLAELEELLEVREPVKPPDSKKGEASSLTKTKFKVLVVEDHADMRNFIVEILRDHFDIQTAANGELALHLLQKGESLPDLILSDVMMPEMDGFALLNRVKAHAEWRNIPMILLTARAAREDRLQALGVGVDDYLTKPFDVAELRARIRNLLSNYQERKQWRQKEWASQSSSLNPEEKPESWQEGWLQKARDIVEREIGNRKFKVSDLAAEMNISESQLLVKMKQITGLTPNEFIRELKLQKARILLENKARSTIAEVAYAAGFNTPGYFSKVYEKRFGKRPGDYFS